LTEARKAEEGSLEQFITEHYWGYSALKDGGTVEYQVAHVPWNVKESGDCGFEGDASRLYGAELTVFWFSVKLRREEAAEGEIPPYGRGFSRHEDLSSDLLFAA
jgi:hypothetical protein